MSKVRDVGLCHVDEWPDDVHAPFRNISGWQGFQLTLVAHVEQQSLEGVVAMVAKREARERDRCAQVAHRQPRRRSEGKTRYEFVLTHFNGRSSERATAQRERGDIKTRGDIAIKTRERRIFDI